VIDRATGALQLDSGTTITVALTRSAFLQKTFGATRELGVKNEPWCSWRVRRVRAGGRTFIVVLYFNAERLHSLELVENDELGLTEWKNWSEAEELRKKRSYEKLLSHEVGYRRSFTWGSARAFYDPRRGNSFIRITYGPSPRDEMWPSFALGPAVAALILPAVVMAITFGQNAAAGILAVLLAALLVATFRRR
jgi:hypothetical protein